LLTTAPLEGLWKMFEREVMNTNHYRTG